MADSLTRSEDRGADEERGSLLIVDDDEHVRQVLGLRLEHNGYRVRGAGDGREALSLIRTTPVDLVLLDIRLPDIDGFKMLRALRQTFSPSELPVIMVTGMNRRSEDTISAFQMGSNDYLTKPIDFPVALARIRTQLTLKRSEDELRRAKNELEHRVEERTAELRRTNAALQQEISERKQAEQEREKLITQLRDALAKVKTLSGLLPICASCKKIRDDEGYWKQMEVYIHEHSEAEFSHSVCPDCLAALYRGHGAAP